MRLPTPSSFDHDRSRAPRRFLRRCPVMPAIDGMRSHCSRGDTNCTPSRRRSGHADGADGTTPGGANGSRRGRPASDFTLTSDSGETVTLSLLRGALPSSCTAEDRPTGSRGRDGLGRRLAARVGRAGDRRAGEAGPPRRAGAGRAARVIEGPKVYTLLAGQQADGGFGTRLRRWGGAHWRLVSLVELGVPAGEPRCLAAARPSLPGSPAGPSRPHSSHRRADAALCVAGGQCTRGLLPARPRRRPACWPARGVACRVAVAGRRLELRQKANGYRSSFNESLPPMWGLHEYWAATGETGAREAAERAALPRAPALPGARHRRADPRVVRDGHSPPFWHCDYFQALVVLARLGLADDRARPTASTCSRSEGSRTAVGAPAAAGGGRRARGAATSRWSTGAPGRTSC